MARHKEICCVLLDVGRRAGPSLQQSCRAVKSLFLSKMLHKPSHEVALVVFGTAGQDNHLHSEFSAEGDCTQYCNITTCKALSPPGLDTLADINRFKAETGASDFMDALTVGIDILYRALSERPSLERTTVVKKIVLMSNFCDEVKDDEADEFAILLADKLAAKSIQVDAVCINDLAATDAQHTTARAANLKKLSQILGRLHCEMRQVDASRGLSGCFRFKEVVHTPYYAGPMTIGDMTTVSVKVSKKTSQEQMPGLDRYSERSTSNDASHSVIYDRAYKKGEDGSEEEVPSEEIGRAFLYGGQIVPFVREAEQVMKYSPDKAFQIIGSIPEASVPRCLLTGETWAVIPEKGNPEAFMAMDALARSLATKKMALVARFVPRLNGDITIGLMTALSNQNGAFAMNHLPFEADVRPADFRAFSESEDLLPSAEQTALMDALLDRCSLDKDNSELLPPEGTANPSLQQFLYAIGRKAGDEVGPAAEDGSLQRFSDVLRGRLESEVVEVERRLCKEFPVGRTGETKTAEIIVPGEGVGATTATSPNAPEIRLTAAIEDFDELLDRGKRGAAIMSMPEVILTLVRNGEVALAVRCLHRLREAAKENKRAATFNDLLDKLTKEQGGSDLYGSISRALNEQNVRSLPV